MKKITVLTSVLLLAACGGGSGGGSVGYTDDSAPGVSPIVPDVLGQLSNLTFEEIELAKNATNSLASVNNADDLIARAQSVYGDVVSSDSGVVRSAGVRNSAVKHNNDKLSRAEKHFENARKMLGDKDWFLENFDNISESDFAKACQLLNIKFANKQEFFDKLDDKDFWREHHHNVNSAHNKLTIEDMYTGGFSMGTNVHHCERRVKDFYANAEEAAEWLDAYGLEWSDIHDDTEFEDIEKPKETTRLLIDKNTGEISFATYYAPGTNMHKEDEESEIRYFQIAQGSNGCLTGTPCDCTSEYGCLFSKDIISNINDLKNGYVEITNEDGEHRITFHNNHTQDNIGLKYSDVLSIAHFEDGNFGEIDMFTMGYDSKQVDMEKLAKDNKIDKKITYSGKAFGVYSTEEDVWNRIQDKDGNLAASATLEFDPNSGTPTEKILAKFSEFGWYDINVTKQYGTDEINMSLTKTDNFDSERFEDSANGLTFDQNTSDYVVRYYGDKSNAAAEEVVGHVHGGFNRQNTQGGPTNGSLDVEFSFGAVQQ